MKKICIFGAFVFAAVMTIGPVRAPAGAPVVVQKDPALAERAGPNAKPEKIAGGFGFAEGALWAPKGRGYPLFSELPGNVIYKWTPDGKVSVDMDMCGYQGVDI